MNPIQRPPDAAPSGMGGATRMHDPSEALHDRRRRRCMNVAFVLIALLTAAQIHWGGMHGLEWLRALLLIATAAPLGVGIKVFELRFKMANAERERMLLELPVRKRAEFLIYALLSIAVFSLNISRLSWTLVGVWGYDFVTYYHDRPERIRHLYAVAKTLDEIRQFRAPWAWALPAVVWEVVKWLTR